MNLQNTAGTQAAFAHQSICDNQCLKPVACEILFRGMKEKTLNNFLEEPHLFVLHLDALVKDKALAIKSLYDTYEYSMYFVNFTPSQIASPDFIHALRWFDDNAISANTVIIEVTELAFEKENNEAFLHNVALARRKGHLIAIDDFGSGYSNFERIIMLRPHIVKLDRSILNLSSHTKRNNHILNSIVSFVHEIGAKCIVEGVENEDLLAIAKKSGADYLQGYHLSYPTLINEPAAQKEHGLNHGIDLFRAMDLKPNYSC
ncbi:EAL domain-containing protein [Colwellia sp. MSW7]|jgi:EAL domain-containing protein (putative c-di-GMP-specific phosphodiesterase class I)|uniref:EAL domain-containing protein n=1 Tax=Colwellia maritima TaxID=2912588 RepID=A0ABS9X748_9GAMM|nr:EAL domain-containing protein [Colwellia maritima]MCI2286034.1 EAL domain-containing protein [Colwellia maritima]